MVLIKKQFTDRSRQMKDMQNRVNDAVVKADHTSENFVVSLENMSHKLDQKNKFFQHNLTVKETDWEENIQFKNDCLLLDGEDPSLGKLGKNFYTDMQSMRNRIKSLEFNTEMNNLLREKWYIIMVVKFKEKLETMFTPVPKSCFKFLLALKQVLLLGQALSNHVFYSILENTVLHEDHKDVVLHRTVSSVRDVLHIKPDTFLEYLEKKEIQPCPELLTQVRQFRKQMVTSAKLAGFAKNNKASALIYRGKRYNATSVMSPNAASPISSRPESSHEVLNLKPGVSFAEDTEPITTSAKIRVFDGLVEEASSLWKQKHALFDRKHMESTDERNSALFATPQTSFDDFGGSNSTVGGVISFLSVSADLIASDEFDDDDNNDDS
jgi:hypothetical protein